MKGKLRRLMRQAEQDAVLIKLKDGSVRAFDAMDAFKEMFLAQFALFKGEAHESHVLDAVRQATSESRASFEKKYGSIEMEAQVIASEPQGGWVEVYKLLEDGTVEHVRHEGDTEEAKRLREEARQRPAAF
jgi:hypothetical protein